MRPGDPRLVLLLDGVALGVVAAALVLGVGLPLAAGGAVRPAAIVALALAVSVVVAVVAVGLLMRSVGAPLERLLAAAASLGGGAAGDLPVLEPPGEAAGHGLSRAAVAFERLAAALAAERARLAEKLGELQRANADLVRARESLLRADRLVTLGRLASGIAHEVGNPLGAITGYVELARDRLGDSGERRAQGQRDPSEATRASPRQEVDDFLARIGDEALRIDGIVRDLLDLARPAEAVLGAVELSVPLEAALRLARVQARFRSVEVAVALPSALPRVLADERRLSQVFLNLLLNAGDAMAGAGQVRVDAAVEGGRVVVRVADTGPGIAPADLPRVFEPFFTTKGAGRGTGLGLAVSQGMVESFGGEIVAANGVTGGAVFTVVLGPAAM